MARILIIDDDVFARHMVTECLRHEHEVIAAEDGAQGILIALTSRPELVICDVGMPDINGFGVLEQLQAADVMANVPFIFLSGTTENTAIREAMSRGADDFLIKPFSMAELKRVVQVRLEKRARQKAMTDKALDELRVSVIASIPHELRTSIMIVEGYAHLLLDSPNELSDDQRDMITAIQGSAMRLRFLSEKYAWFLKTQTQDWRQLKKSPVRLDQIIKQTATAVAQRFERQATMALILDPFTMVVEQEALTKAIEEIVDNAFKFSDANSPVTIFGLCCEDRYTISILNIGRGFTPEQIERINGFVQFDRQLYEQQGLGLGLVIARRLAELCGGQFAITSEAGKTTVSIVLPSMSPNHEIPRRVSITPSQQMRW